MGASDIVHEIRSLDLDILYSGRKARAEQQGGTNRLDGLYSYQSTIQENNCSKKTHGNHIRKVMAEVINCLLWKNRASQSASVVRKDQNGLEMDKREERKEGLAEASQLLLLYVVFVDKPSLSKYYNTTIPPLLNKYLAIPRAKTA